MVQIDDVHRQIVPDFSRRWRNLLNWRCPDPPEIVIMLPSGGANKDVSCAASGGAISHAIIGSGGSSGVGNVGLRGGNSGAGRLGRIVAGSAQEVSGFSLADDFDLTSASPAVAQGEAPRFPSPSVKGLPADATASGRPDTGTADLSLQGSCGACISPAPAATGFGDIEHRLQVLGATYYRLESWGNEQQLYRFYCKVAVGGNADYAHCFEAVHADPRQAMLQVLHQVEAWRDGGALRAESGGRKAENEVGSG